MRSRITPSRTTSQEPKPSQPLQQASHSPQLQPDSGCLFPSPKQLRAAVVLAVLSLFSCGTLCISNIMAIKIWQLGVFILDGGIIIFPIIYVIDDVLSEIFRQKIANIIKFCSCFIDVILIFGLRLTIFLPAATDVDSIDPSTALGGLPLWITLASAIATFLSGLLNNAIHDHLHRRAPDEYTGIGSRAWWSSVVAHFADSMLFTFLAFGGVHAHFASLLQQAITSYVASVIVEIFFLPLTIFAGKTLKRFIHSAE